MGNNPLGFRPRWYILLRSNLRESNPVGVPVGELKKYGEDFFIAFKLIGEYEAYRLEGEVLKYLGVVGHIKTENSPTDLVNFAITRLGDSRNYKDFYRKSIRASAEKLKTMTDDIWVI